MTTKVWFCRGREAASEGTHGSRSKGDRLVRQQIQQLRAMAGKFPPLALPDNQMTAGILVMVSLIDGEELVSPLAFDLGSGTGDEFNRNPVEIHPKLVTGDAFFRRHRIPADKRGITL